MVSLLRNLYAHTIRDFSNLTSWNAYLAEKLSASRHHASKLVDLFKLAKRVEFAEKLAPFVQAANAMDCTLAAHDNDLSQVRTLAVGMTDDLLDLRQK